MFGDSILKAFEGSLLCWFWGGWVGEVEDVLGEREERETVVCWLGTHL